MKKAILALTIYFVSLNAQADFSASAKDLITILADDRVEYFLKDGGELLSAERIQMQSNKSTWYGYKLITSEDCKMETYIVPLNSEKNDVLVFFRGCN